MGLSDILKGALGSQPAAPGAGTGGLGSAALQQLIPAGLSMLGGQGAAGQAGGGATTGMGGIGGLVAALTKGGLGDVVNSWVGTGANLPVSPDGLQNALGHDRLSQVAAQAGIPADSIASVLSGVLPGIVDKLTPDGKIPEGDLSGSAGSLLASVLGSSPGPKA